MKNRGKNMSRFLRSGLAKASQSLPRDLLFWPYALLIKYLKAQTDSLGAQLWLRNSLRLGYWEFAQSDIDLAIWVKGGAGEALQVWHTLKSKRFALLGGEVQIYSSDWVHKMLPYANPWEVARDPDLLRHAKFAPAAGTAHEQLVFLIKMLSSDKELWVNAASRQKKWQYHLAQLGIRLEGPVTGEFVCGLIFERLDFVDVEYAALEAYFHTPRPVPALPTAATDLDRLLNPNKYCWFAQATAQDEIFLRKLDERGHAYLATLMSWEVWGLFPLTQVVQELSQLQLEGHIINQRRLLERLVVPTAHLQSGFSLLTDYYAEISGSY